MRKLLILLFTVHCSLFIANAHAADVVARPGAGTAQSTGMVSTRASATAAGAITNTRTAGATVPTTPLPADTISRAAKRTSVMSSGTTIAAKGTPVGLYSDECKTYYDECLNQFCMLGNEDGGRCACSDDYEKYDAQRAAIKIQLANADTLSSLEVEKIQAGARADIIFSGERVYDKDGNVITLQKQDKKKDTKKRVDLSQWLQNLDTEFEGFDMVDALADKKGAALYTGARQLCLQNMPDNCARDVTMLTQIYLTQIRSDCNAFANLVTAEQKDADEKLAIAQKDVRDARLASFAAENKFNRGTCLIKFKECMVKPEVCSADWSRCASTVASENMQNNKARSVAGTSVGTTDKFKISKSTLEMLSSKRTMCEDILDQCVAVRDMVWPDFLTDIAPELKLAELNLESNMRQSCMADISACITGKACRDSIQKGENIDLCLTKNGQIARGVCKNVIDPCERMEPLIWDYTVARLRAVGADRCTEEVKNCYTGICGEKFENCIGMDYKFMHEICPLEKLVVCKNNYAQSGREFTMDDLDKLLMGFYLNVDNAALANCENIVTTKMMEICGSTTDCNRFAADDTLGSNSVKSQKIGDLYRVTGMISFGSIKVGTSDIVRDGEKKLGAGQIGVTDYINEIRENNTTVIPNREAIIGNIESELNNIAGTINRTIELISADPKIQFCITGRNLDQIVGTESGRGSGRNRTNMTTARFPNLMDSVKMIVAESALRRANDNYNKKLNDEIAKATLDASADLAQFMCQKMAETGGVLNTVTPSSTLTAPYAISYDIALGITKDDLMKQSAYGQSHSGGMTFESGASVASGGRFKTSGGGVTRETWANFNRETRTCKFCTSSVTESCSAKKSNGLFGLFGSTKTSCTASDPVESCQDIPM